MDSKIFFCLWISRQGKTDSMEMHWLENYIMPSLWKPIGRKKSAKRHGKNLPKKIGESTVEGHSISRCAVPFL